MYKINDELAVIQTVDFFPPIVDDPYLYGQIAAANALSDIYAMGAEPMLALNIVCFPSALPLTMLKEMMAGGAEKVREAGAIIAGGHSIDDPQPKYGLCVSGFANPTSIWTNASAKEGDLLILTKPLGSGITNTAAKADLLTAEQLQPTYAVMAMLNKYARDVAVQSTVNACTDITGFGLLGHALEMANASHKTIEVFSSAMPLLPHALEMAELEIVPGGAYRNREHTAGKIHIAEDISEPMSDILFDPQTSGGLLLSVPAWEAHALLERLKAVCPQTAIIGRVLPRAAYAVFVRSEMNNTL